MKGDEESERKEWEDIRSFTDSMTVEEWEAVPEEETRTASHVGENVGRNDDEN